MATIRKLPNSKYRTEIRKRHTLITSKTFSTRGEAVKWGNVLDSQIAVILIIKPKKLAKLSSAKVEALGGMDLFRKLGIELEFLVFSDLVSEYNEQWTGKDKNQKFRANYWASIFGPVPVKNIKVKHVRRAIDAFAKECKKDGAGKPTNKSRSSNTVIRYKAVLSAIFKYAVQRGYLKDNPVSGVFVKPTPNKINRYLSEAEREALLSACRDSTWDRLYVLVLMAITTGMRKSELMGLRWNDIDFEMGLATLGDTKNGEPRINVIPDVTLTELRNFRQVGAGLVFASPTRQESPFEFIKQWKAALLRAGISNLRFHDLRHTAASYLIMNGATLKEVAEVLGHKSLQTTDRYAHLSTQHKSRLVNRVMGQVLCNV